VHGRRCNLYVVHTVSSAPEVLLFFSFPLRRAWRDGGDCRGQREVVEGYHLQVCRGERRAVFAMPSRNAYSRQFLDALGTASFLRWACSCGRSVGSGSRDCERRISRSTEIKICQHLAVNQNSGFCVGALPFCFGLPVCPRRAVLCMAVYRGGPGETRRGFSPFSSSGFT